MGQQSMRRGRSEVHTTTTDSCFSLAFTSLMKPHSYIHVLGTVSHKGSLHVSPQQSLFPPQEMSRLGLLLSWQQSGVIHPPGQ